MNNDNKKERYARYVLEAERGANNKLWVSCYWCYRTWTEMDEGGIKGLAEQTGKSDDTLYDRAHAYDMFTRLRSLPGKKNKMAVNLIRKLPYIYWSHFRALWDVQKAWNLSDQKIMNLLMEIYQAEGKFSARKIEKLAEERFGEERDWKYYAERTSIVMQELINHPNTPNNIRDSAKKTYDLLSKSKSS